MSNDFLTSFIANFFKISLVAVAAYGAVIVIGLVFYYLAYCTAKGVFKARSEFPVNNITTVSIKSDKEKAE